MVDPDRPVYLGWNRRRAHRLPNCATRGLGEPTESTWGEVKGEIPPCHICGKAMLMELERERPSRAADE